MLGIATRISGLLALRNRLVASSAARLLWAAPPSASFLVGYYGSAWLTTSVPRRDPATGLDLLMPCVPAFVWVYLAGLFLPFAPLLLLPQRQLPRMALAYSALIGAAAISFLALPTDGAALRASCADPGWALLAVYRFDPPTNLFPSLHVGLPTLACLCLKQADSRWTQVVAALAAAQALAVCLVKQHVLADVMAGALFAWLAYRLTLAGSRALASQP